MTLTETPTAFRPLVRKTGPQSVSLSAQNQTGDITEARMPKLTYEIAALRADTSLFIGQTSAPAIPLFESAFSAFTHGSLIQTPQGPVAVEDLQPGDMIQTVDGEASELIWIGTTTFSPIRGGKRMPLVRIMPDAFGQSRPERSLTVGPGARILHTPPALRGLTEGKQLLTPATMLVDGANVIEISPPTPTRLFHICLAKHAVIYVNGIEFETFHPGPTAAREVSHSLRDRFLSLFPRISHIADFGPLAYTRAPDIHAL